MVPRAHLIGTSLRRLRAPGPSWRRARGAWPGWRPSIGSTGAREAAGLRVAVDWAMLRACTQGPYLRSRVSRVGVPRPSRWPWRTEARASAAPSPEPRCGPWVPGRLLSARPSGFAPGRLHPSPPRVRAFLPCASQAASVEGHPAVPSSLPLSAARLRRLRRAGSGVRPAAGTSAGGGTRAGAQEAGSPARPPRWAERPAPAPSAGATRGRRPHRAGRSPVRNPCVVLVPAFRPRPPAMPWNFKAKKWRLWFVQGPKSVAAHHQGPGNLGTWVTNQKLDNT